MSQQIVMLSFCLERGRPFSSRVNRGDRAITMNEAPLDGSIPRGHYLESMEIVLTNLGVGSRYGRNGSVRLVAG